MAEKRAAEMQALKTQLGKTKNAERRDALRSELGGLAARQQKDDAARAAAEAKAARRRAERSAVEQGKKPYFLKAADARTLELAKKFETLQARPSSWRFQHVNVL